MGQNHSFGLASKFKTSRRGKPTQTMTRAEVEAAPETAPEAEVAEAEADTKNNHNHRPSPHTPPPPPPNRSFLGVGARAGIETQTLPHELRLHILSLLPLKTIIASSGVCREWRTAVPQCVAAANPARYRLYLLFRAMLDTAGFERTRGWVVGCLRPFERGWFVDAVGAQSGYGYGAVPEEFAMWILEWPAKMAINSLWPGLPFTDCHADSVQRTYGVNWLGQAPPQLSAVVYQSQYTGTGTGTGTGKLEAKYVPALLLWRNDFDSHWLMLDKAEPGLYGRVVITTCGLTESAAIIPGGFMERDGFGFYAGGGGGGDNGKGRCANGVYSDWLEFQECEWERMKRRLQVALAREPPGGGGGGGGDDDGGSKTSSRRYDSVGFYRVDIELGSQRPFELPCPPWLRRDEDEFVGYLNSINL